MCWQCPEKIGNKIMKVTKWHEGKKLSDGKGILGKGRLANKIINKMQNYYVMAIHQNALSLQNIDKEKALYSMKKSLFSTLCHCTDMPDNQERQAFCPSESNSWCKYWQSGGSEDYKSSVNLPNVIRDLLVRIFLDL